MTTRRVTALEEQILAASRDYAEAVAKYRALIEALAMQYGRAGCALRPETEAEWRSARVVEFKLLDLAKRLRKQREKK